MHILLEETLENLVKILCTEHVNRVGQIPIGSGHDLIETLHKERDLVLVDLPHVVVDILTSNLQRELLGPVWPHPQRIAGLVLVVPPVTGQGILSAKYFQQKYLESLQPTLNWTQTCSGMRGDAATSIAREAELPY